MVRRKTNSIAQVNLRITPQLQQQLAAAAIAHGNTFSREVRARLVESLVEPELTSLAEFLSDFERRARDIVEHNARGSRLREPQIEATFRRLAALRTKIVHFQTGIEEVLLHDMHIPELRALVRGGETKPKSKAKSSQQD
jgi:hypothetical protein